MQGKEGIKKKIEFRTKVYVVMERRSFRVKCNHEKINIFVLLMVLVLGMTSVSAIAATPTVSYESHISGIGWQGYRSNGTTSGTTGQSRQMEAIKIKLSGVAGGIQYRVHIKDKGWMPWVSNDVQAGTTGQSLRMEAIQIKLTGDVAKRYDIYYRLHVEDLGWRGWAKNGAPAGTTGCGLRAEAIQIKLVNKNSTAPGDTKYAYVAAPDINYKAHVSDIGWQRYVKNGTIAGTTGESKQMEAVKISLTDLLGGSGVQYRVHIQDKGWSDWVTSDKVAGTTGESKRIEAVQIELTGHGKNVFDIYYRVHVADKGWLGWATNGEKAGTEGGSLRMEAIQIKLVIKEDSFNREGKAFYDLTSTDSGNNSNSSQNGYANFDPIWPLANSYNITTLYYYSSGKKHSTRYQYGIDMAAPKGENVLAVESGTVIASEYSTTSGLGNWIRVRHSNGKVSLYAHLDTRSVRKGDTVAKGQVIGTVGNSSAKYKIGYHLHFELGSKDVSGATGDAWKEYYKIKYGNKVCLTQAAKKYPNP